MGLVLIQDTREQSPLSFPKGIEVTRDTLPYGDYGAEVDGQRLPIVFERKGHQDLVSTLTNSANHERFRRELLAAREANVQLLLGIEVPFRQVLDGNPYSSVPGETIIKIVFSLWIRYGLRPFFCHGRRELAQVILATFEAIERGWQSGG